MRFRSSRPDSWLPLDKWDEISKPGSVFGAWSFSGCWMLDVGSFWASGRWMLDVGIFILSARLPGWPDSHSASIYESDIFFLSPKTNRENSTSLTHRRF